VSPRPPISTKPTASPPAPMPTWCSMPYARSWTASAKPTKPPTAPPHPLKQTRTTMPNPWNFGDTLADAIQANRNRAHETNLTLYQLAQQQRQMNALRDFQRQQLDLQGEQIGIDRAREARLAAEAQRNYELNFIDPDGEGPMGQVSRYQY